MFKVDKDCDFAIGCGSSMSLVGKSFRGILRKISRNTRRHQSLGVVLLLKILFMDLPHQHHLGFVRSAKSQALSHLLNGTCIF